MLLSPKKALRPLNRERSAFRIFAVSWPAYQYIVQSGFLKRISASR